MKKNVFKNKNYKSTVITKLICLLFFLNFTVKNSFAAYTVPSGTSVTWNSATTLPNYNDGLIIPGGSELSITGITLNMDLNSKIEVQIGGKLILNNVVITSTNPYETWLGIEARGDGNIKQFSTFPNYSLQNNVVAWEGVLNTSQTFVKITGGEIYYAKIGVRSFLGAIIRSTGTIFEDCETSIKIEPYSNFLQPNLNVDHNYYNACYFMNNAIYWTDQYANYFPGLNYIGISLNSVKGVNIGGLYLLNSGALINKRCIEKQGIGILAQNSDLSLGNSGNSITTGPSPLNCDNNKYSGVSTTSYDNSFNYVGTAIKFIGNAGSGPLAENKASIQYTKFNDNYYNIYLKNSKDILVYKCEFNTNIQNNFADIFDLTSPCSTPLNRYDIHSENAEGLRIVYNNFTDHTRRVNTLEIGSPPTNGRSLIMKNNFFNFRPTPVSGDPVRGIVIQGTHGNLRITCNEFRFNTNDIRVENGSSLNNQWFGKRTRNVHTNKTSFPGVVNIINLGTSFEYAYSGVVPNRTGAVNLYITNNNPTPDCEEFTCNNIKRYAGLKENNIQNNNHKFAIYPNPVKNNLTIESADIYQADIKIYNTLGMEISSIQNRDLPAKLDITHFTPGVYFLLISNDGQSFYSMKFIKD